MAKTKPQTREEFKKRLKGEHNGLLFYSIFILAVAIALIVILVVGWSELENYVYEIGLVFFSKGIPLVGVRIVWIVLSLYGIYKSIKAFNLYKEYKPSVKELLTILNASDILTEELSKKATYLLSAIEEDSLNLVTKWF